jgi:hypothetical protein
MAEPRLNKGKRSKNGDALAPVVLTKYMATAESAKNKLNIW